MVDDSCVYFKVSVTFRPPWLSFVSVSEQHGCVQMPVWVDVLSIVCKTRS